MHIIKSSLALACFAMPLSATEFQEPVALQAGGNVIKTPAPGYGSPCWADLDKDGKQDLIVGIYSSGKILVYKGLEGGKLATGNKFKIDEKSVSVPGVW